MHNGQLADPTNKFTRELRELTKKKNKTDADHTEIKRVEWLGGLYRDEQGRICVTEDMILGAVIGGAKAAKKGTAAKAAVLGAAPSFPLTYKGPSDPLDLFNTGNFCEYRLVVVDRKRVMRARPKFNQWSVSVGLLYDDGVMNDRDLISALEQAGHTVGLGDFRPRFGRFTVERGL